MPKRIAPLSDIQVKNAKPKEKDTSSWMAMDSSFWSLLQMENYGALIIGLAISEK
jgi:hypothetical protein